MTEKILMSVRIHMPQITDINKFRLGIVLHAKSIRIAWWQMLPGSFHISDTIQTNNLMLILVRPKPWSDIKPTRFQSPLSSSLNNKGYFVTKLCHIDKKNNLLG